MGHKMNIKIDEFEKVLKLIGIDLYELASALAISEHMPPNTICKHDCTFPDEDEDCQTCWEKYLIENLEE